jgi:hypothetical protein
MQALVQFGAPPLLFLSEFRDVVVIIWGILSVLLLLALALSILILTLSVKRLIRDVGRLLDADVKPVLESARESVDNVAGTTRFLGDKAVAPVIRIMGLISAVRRGAVVLSGVTGRRRHSEEET